MDLNLLRELMFADRRPRAEKPNYFATAGAPAAGKTTLLEKRLAEDPDLSQAVYIDPNTYLRLMAHTHQHDVSAYAASRLPDGAVDAARTAYTKWRDASIYIARSLFSEARRGGYDIAHGSTLTDTNVGTLLKELKAEGYSRTILACFADDETRRQANSIRERSGVINVTPEEFESKATAFLRQQPVYRANAEQLHLLWRDGADKDAITAATFANGEKTILDVRAFSRIDDFYHLKSSSLLTDLTPWSAVYGGSDGVAPPHPGLLPG